MGKCIKCGHQGSFRLFCHDCYLRDHPLVAGVRLVEIKVCSNCKKFLLKNKWKDTKDLDSAIADTIIEKLSLSKEYQVKDVTMAHNLGEFTPKQGMRLEGEATLTIKARSEDDELDVEDEYIVPFDLMFTYCGNCSLKGSKYFEGILQVRNASPELIEKIEAFSNKDVHAGSFVNKIEATRDGVDYYMTSNHHLKQLGLALQKKFGGTIEESPRLQTRDGLASKDLYRLTVLLRFSDVTPGDFIEHEGRILHIKKTGKEIIGRDILNNTNVKLDPSKEKPKPLEIHHTVITKVQPQIEAMNPVDFQSEKVENAKKQKMGQKVQIVIANGKLYMVNTPHQF